MMKRTRQRRGRGRKPRHARQVPRQARQTRVAEGSDQPVIRSGCERYVYALDRADHGVTGYAGLPVALEGFEALGLGEACRRELKLKQRQRGPTETEWVQMLVLLRLAGGERVEDVARLKQDDGLRRLWPALGGMSARSALDFLMRFHDPEQQESVPGRAVIRPDTAGLAALGRVNEALVHTVQREHPVRTATLDVDASIHGCDKRAALRTYEGTRGYQPVAAYWVEQRLVVGDEFRDGNVPAGMGNVEVVTGGAGRVAVGRDAALCARRQCAV